MLVRACAVLSLVLLILPPVQADEAAKAEAPIVSVQIRSVHDLLADIGYLATLAGQEEQAKQFQAMIQSVGGEKGLQGINEKEPIGFYKNDLTNPTSGVVLVPISDQKAALTLLANLGQQPKKGADGVYTLSLDFPPVTLYFRFANKYAYVSANNKDSLTGTLLKPADVFKAHAPALLSAQFRVDQIPANLKEFALSAFDGQLDNAKEMKESGETEAQHKLKVQMLDDFSKRAHRVVEQGGTLALSFDIDQQAHRLRVGGSFTGKSGSTLASNIAELASVKSLFAGAVSPDSAMTLLMRGSTPANLRKDFEAAINDGMAKALKKEKNEGQRRVAERLLKALTPSLTAGQLDVLLNMRGPSADKQYTMVAAARLKDGLKVEQAFADTINQAPPKDRAIVKLNAEKIGDVQVARIDIQKAAKEDYRKVFGNNPGFVAFRDDAVVAAWGPGALDALRETLAAQPKVAPVFELTLSTSHLVPFLAKEHPQAAKVAQQVFHGQADNDKVQVRLHGGPALRFDLTVQSGALKFLGRLAAQKRAANAEKTSSDTDK